MKKTLIALAALAATAGVAHAQSSVTLYGIADAYVGVNRTETSSATVALRAAKVSQGVVNGSGLSSSRWGLRGSEDLGGGLAAVFTLESGFDISTGAQANVAGSSSATSAVLFGRTATVGLKGGFGETRLGRQYTAYDSLRGVTNNTYDSNTFATTGAIWGVGIQDYSNRINNSISYASPVFGGFSGSVVYGFGEDKSATASASNSVSAQVRYANGPLLVGYAFQRERSTVASTIFSNANGPALAAIGAVGAVGTADTRKYHLVGASWDFGVAKLTGSYNQAKNNTLKDREYQVGVSVPFGAASIAAGYTHAKSETQASNASTDGTGYSLLGTYDLSKRTTLYAGYINMKAENAAGTAEAKRSLFASGVRHTF
jgi:predicted porin